jgi:2-polyprenyl-6-methoxyphenol hydroxylase-like FAD-dependent oxidoreductase
MATTEVNALIIGTGIAGPIVAMAIQQADIQPTIYEASIETSKFSAGHVGCPAPTVSLSHRRGEVSSR